MKVFLDFLDNFSATALLQMYASGAFRTADEIKMADFTINYKIIFNHEVITNEELEVYRHLQRLMDTIRARQRLQRCAASNDVQELFRYFSTDETHFNYFTKYGENERQSIKLNIVERRIIFAFKKKNPDVSTFDWLKEALTELLKYVLREFTESDRVGIVIKNEENPERKATFPISPKPHLEASVIIDTLNSIVKIKGSFLAEERMTLQVVRMRLPPIYRTFENSEVVGTDSVIQTG